MTEWNLKGEKEKETVLKKFNNRHDRFSSALMTDTTYKILYCTIFMKSVGYKISFFIMNFFQMSGYYETGKVELDLELLVDILYLMYVSIIIGI